MLAPVIAAVVLVIPDLYMGKRETDRTVQGEVGMANGSGLTNSKCRNRCEKNQKRGETTSWWG